MGERARETETEREQELELDPMTSPKDDLIGVPCPKAD